MEIKYVKTHPDAVVPQRQTPGSAGFDLAACLDAPVEILPGQMAMIPLGFAAEIPPGFAGFIFSRSGLGSRGVVVAQGVGVIDSDYRGSWLVPLRNLSSAPYTVCPGDRIAQAVFMPAAAPCFVEAAALSGTARGQEGFGSTG